MPTLILIHFSSRCNMNTANFFISSDGYYMHFKHLPKAHSFVWGCFWALCISFSTLTDLYKKEFLLTPYGANNPTETHALVDNNIQASPKDIFIQLSIHLPLTMKCAIGLTVGGALQLLLLLLLVILYSNNNGGAVQQCEDCDMFQLQNTAMGDYQNVSLWVTP